MMHDDEAEPGREGAPVFRPVLVSKRQDTSAPGQSLVCARARSDDAARRSAALGGHVEWLEADDVVAELFEDQLTLSMKLASLDALAGAGRTPRVFPHLRQLGAVRDALARLLFATRSHRVRRALLPMAPLAEYVRGVYAWTLAVTDALDVVLGGAGADWTSFQASVKKANNLHFDQLESEIAVDFGALAQEEPAARRLAHAFYALLAEACRLEEQLAFDG